MKTLLIKILNLLFIPKIFRFLFQRNVITVIYYHDISKESFAKQISYIKSNYNIIDIDTLRNYLYKEEEIPKYSILITFDDGHIGNYTLLDVIIRNKIRPVIFLTANIIGTNKPYWFNLPFPDDGFKEKLKKIPDSERKNIINKIYSKDLIINSPEALTIKQIEEMNKYVDFQSHTLDHPCLPNASDTVAEHEIRESKVKIEEITRKEVYSIAYPNGDVSKRDIEYVKNSDYLIGFATTKGYVDKVSDPFLLNRISINDTDNFNEFKLRVSGVWYRLKMIIN